MLEPRRVIAFAATLVISVLVSLLVDRPARAHDMDALYQAAKQEGALNLYGGGPAASFTARAKKFEQRFPGITVNVVGGFSNRLTGQIDAALGYSFRLYVDLKDRGVPVDDIVLMPMADYGLKLYGNAIIINPKFAADKPEAVRAFLHAFLRGLKDIVRRPADAVDAVVRRDETLKKEVELERLRMAIRDNIVTPEVKADGLGAVDFARLGESIDQIGLVYTFKAKPKAQDIFDASFLPPADERRVH